MVKGATRYTFLATLLVERGFDVDFITSGFQRWEKRQLDLATFDTSAHAFNVKFIAEPSYPANMCPPAHLSAPCDGQARDGVL